MAQQNELSALPLLGSSGDFLLKTMSVCWSRSVYKAAVAYVLNLVLVEIRNAIDNHPGKRAAKVDEFVHQEGHDAGGEHVVANVGVPCHPQLLKVIEVHIVLGHLFELVPVRV